MIQNEFVKWWKDKIFVLIILVGLLAVGLSALFACLFPNYIGLIIVVCICIVCGISIRFLINKKLNQLADKYR